ncbi:MAG: hypothetical protein ACO4CW_10410 [Planctomycetota bacterium]
MERGTGGMHVRTPFWLLPMGFGGMLFFLGVLIWLEEDLLRFIVAAAFCFLGLGIMAVAWRLRGGGVSATRGRTVDFRVERDDP